MAIGTVTNVEHGWMLVEKVIPAIKAKFPSSCKNKPLYIQLDNARPNTVKVDELIKQHNRCLPLEMCFEFFSTLPSTNIVPFL